MIKKSNKQSINSIIGYRYSPIIQNKLTGCNEFNKNGVPYLTRYILNVMNGKKMKTDKYHSFRKIKSMANKFKITTFSPYLQVRC